MLGAKAARAPRDLLDLGRRQQAEGGAIVLLDRGEDDAANVEIDAHACEAGGGEVRDWPEEGRLCALCNCNTHMGVSVGIRRSC